MRSADSPTPSKPIIILGAPRSGTTYLGGLLGVHPDVLYLAEPRLTWKYGNERKSDMLGTADARPEVRRHIREAFGRRVAASRKPRLVEKTPSNSLRPAFVDAVFPDCRFIHVVRRGLDAALSIRDRWEIRATGLNPGAENPERGNRMIERVREVGLARSLLYGNEVARRAAPRLARRFLGPPLWGPRLPGMDGLVRELDPLTVACLQWRACVETASRYGRRLGPDRYLEIRIEDLNTEVLDRVLEFSELPASQEVVSRFEATWSEDMLGSRRRTASPSDIDVITRCIEPTQAWLGFGD